MLGWWSCLVLGGGLNFVVLGGGETVFYCFTCALLVSFLVFC